MDHFLYENGELHVENVAIAEIAAQVDTPFYCYSTATLRHHMQTMQASLAPLNPKICFAVKANGNPHILRVMAQAGAGADVVSEGEIRLAMKAGIAPNNIVFSGIGKTKAEVRFALEQQIFQFNVESLAELHALNEVAGQMQTTAPIAIRINPDVDAITHEKITTGRKDSKFGIDIDIAPEVFAVAKSLPNLIIRGVSVHIGSQLTSLAPFAQAFTRVREFVESMRADGYAMPVVDLGGGLGIPYDLQQQSPPTPAEYGAMIVKIMQGLEAEFVFEPGRLIAGNAGVLVASVIYIKQGLTDFAIIDAGMNDLARPAIYGSYHEIISVAQKPNEVAYHVVGPVCESSDIFAKNVALPVLHPDDLVVIRSAGAYGASMSSTYNARLVVPEVLVDGDEFRIIRRRKSYEEMLKDYDT